MSAFSRDTDTYAKGQTRKAISRLRVARIASGSMSVRSVPPNAGVRHWAINGDFLALSPTGVARYATETTRALDTLVSEGNPLAEGLALRLVAARHAPETLRLQSIPVDVVPEFSSPRLPQFWVQAQLPRHVLGGLVSFCNLAPVSVRRQIVCMHDAQTWLAPQSYTPMFRWLHKAVLPLLGRRVAHVTTVSEFSRAQLIELGVVAPERISVTFNGSDHAERWQATRSCLPVSGRRPYVLAIGRHEAHKNLDLLMNLAPMLERIGVDMWIAGNRDALGSRGSALDGQGNVRLLGRVDDDVLKFALSGAICFLLPSRIEGFGLPAIEAMASGCPVVVAASPCLPEICADAALYAGADEPVTWLDQISSLLHDPLKRQAMVAAGLARAGEFTWRRVAENYLRLMHQIDFPMTMDRNGQPSPEPRLRECGQPVGKVREN